MLWNKRNDQSNLYIRGIKSICCTVPFFTGLSIGANAVIARQIGQGENAKIQRSVHTSVALALLFCAGILNVLLNLLLVIVFHLGVAGVAIATVISNVLSVALALLPRLL